VLTRDSLLKQRDTNVRASFAELKEEIATLKESGKEHWNYQEAYLYWLQQRVYPRSTLNWEAYERAFDQRSKMSAVGFRDSRLNNLKLLGNLAPRWKFLGPNKLPVPPSRQFHGEGTTSGRVNGLAYDPRNPNIIYLAAAGGGFWKSEDRGKTWSCLSDGWQNVKFSRVAVNPQNSNIIAVGTGDYNGKLGHGYGLMLTDNGGQTWRNALRRELRWQSVSQILFDPDNPRIITVTAGRHPQNRGAVFRSDDGGVSWSRKLAAAGDIIDWGNVQASAPNARGERSYYAVGVSPTTCTPGEIWHSPNRGDTWTALNMPTLAGNCMNNMDIATSPSDPKTVYLMTHEDSGVRNAPALGRIWVSNDTGLTWNPITDDNNFPHHGHQQKRAFNWMQASYDFYIRCVAHPTTGRDVIYVGLIDLIASTDNGRTWQSVGETSHPNSKTHNDQHAFAVNPRNPAEFLIGNDGGVYRLTYKRERSRDSWSFQNNLNDGLGITMFYRIAIDPSNPDWVMGGTQDNATPVSMGNLDEWSSQGRWDGGFCAINPLNNRVQYLTSQHLDIFKTDTAWSQNNQKEITAMEPLAGVPTAWGGDETGFIAPIVLSPGNPNLLYAGTNHLWRWDDSVQDWTGKRLGNQQLASGDGYINFIAIAPTDPRRIYTGSNVGDLWMSTDGGSEWVRLDNRDVPGGGIPNYAITSIAVHPTNPDRILVGFGSTELSSHIWRCDNTRADELRWRQVGGSGDAALPFMPVNAIIIDPQAPDSKFYVGTDVGVFHSDDGGTTWANFGNSNGLPNVQVTDLQLIPGSRRLVAATYGRGAWKIDLTEGVDLLYLKPSQVTSPRSGRLRQRRKLR
jgi:photosystem II stability/assembly factor-like uncharacterized protein